ncbi:MAG: hypothetical protein AB7I30_17030 [Isosphaeraceae bacterium]
MIPRSRRWMFSVATLTSCCLGLVTTSRADDSSEARPPAGDVDLRFWLENMLVYHRFSPEEASAATGLGPAEVTREAARLGVDAARAPRRNVNDPLRVLPYPGGRHPRIGFLDGAVRPQRETKFSVFTPWDAASYVVVDLPEAIWSNLGLTYLAHTHVPTVWSKQGVTLPRREWERKPGGVLQAERRLPNGISFAAKVVPSADSVRMSLKLTNGTEEPLSDLRVQQCVMLKGAVGFEAQTNENKVFQPPYVAVRSADGERWIITAWTPCHRAWGNPPCPCLHSDPKFPDCPPGESREVLGWLSFYEGKDLEGEFQRIEDTNWRRVGP